MKCSESWLREWVNPALTREALCDTLTMAGLEVEELAAAAQPFSNIVVGQVLSVNKHPEADRLNICEVNAGDSKPLSIVCGASNVKAGMKVPVAKIGAALPNQTTIQPTKIRGVASEGMLCSASELGLAEESQGLLALPNDAPIGDDIRHFLKLDDYTIDISITPNRGDCLSVKGLAREIAALTKTTQHPVVIKPIKAAIDAVLPVKIDSASGCPRYAGRVIRGVKADAESPVWLKERLRRSGIRSISAIVDVTNYVMLELGQPMHAFDLHTIQHGIVVRPSKTGEKIALLDGGEKELDDKTLVIADQQKPLAIAGVMGGLESSVTLLTRDIFLESAYFAAPVIARQRQFYNLNSDSAYRFERGVDSTIQVDAIERASQLILEIAGGEAGQVIEVKDDAFLPKQPVITLTMDKVTQLLGVTIPANEIENILKSLGFTVSADKHGWMIKVPPYRFDISLPEDIIEEIARLFGYDNIPTHEMHGNLRVHQAGENSQDLHLIRQVLSDQGFHEIISYSFIDKKLQQLLDPAQATRELLNPITADMSIMRTNLWPGLINTFHYNKSRQQHRVRLFEIGTCFLTAGSQLTEKPMLGGLISGLAQPEQWGIPSREADFFDLKGSLEALINAICPGDMLTFKPDTHPALHPGQSAGIYLNDQKIGILGALHPSALKELDISGKVFVFEIALNMLQTGKQPHYRDISKFPEIRRDIAILVNDTVPVKAIQDTIKVIAGDWLKDVFIFDVYQGKGISPGLKSIALGLILQHPTRTLVDDEVAKLMESVISTLKGQLGAELRS